MSWDSVGDWLKANSGKGASLIGALLTGNVPMAVATGISLVSSATGETTPDSVLQALQQDSTTIVKLKELAIKEEDSIREHIKSIHLAELIDAQHQHEQTQNTIRAGDRAEDKLVRWTRPGQSWLFAIAGIMYITLTVDPNESIAAMLFASPWAYAGLRQVGKGINSISDAMISRTKAVG